MIFLKVGTPERPLNLYAGTSCLELQATEKLEDQSGGGG